MRFWAMVTGVGFSCISWVSFGGILEGKVFWATANWGGIFRVIPGFLEMVSGEEGIPGILENSHGVMDISVPKWHHHQKPPPEARSGFTCMKHSNKDYAM